MTVPNSDGRNRMYLDLHIHSERSMDSRISVKQIITRCIELGLAGFSVTDHDQFSNVQSPYPDLLAIPGSEISTVDGHILALGINEPFPSFIDAAETIDLIHEQGALAIASHPFSSKEEFPGLGDLVYDLKLDGLEITNPKGHIDNKRARKVANTLSIAKVGGSDAHDLLSIGIGLTVLREPVETVDDFLAEVRGGRTDGLLRK